MAKASSKKRKASTAGRPAPSFYEVVFRGRPKIVRSFLAGLRYGSGDTGSIFYHYDVGIYSESKAETLAERVGVIPADVHAVVDASTGKLLKRLRSEITEQTKLEILSCRHIRSARLRFKFKVYAPQYQEQITALIRNLPPGLRLVDYVHDEKINPEARGTEAYAPVHDYEACGEGKVVGRVDLLVGLRKQMVQQPLIEEGEIELRLA